uniref:Calponin-homology (CH) domain-containing protein n=1 Tax=Setaria digitata TaxID=48799 RepID=A0A915Q2T4_9BILA
MLSTVNQEESIEQMILEDRQPDAAWKKIQQNTFTRWVNQKLEPVNVEVTDLETDFEEGLKLIRLVEVLSGRSLGRYSRKVTFRHQKLENISLALKFLENEEHIKIVNIDSSAIADRNLKLILGLVWTLILHYSISKQIWDDQTGGTAKIGDVSPKAKLMTWLKGKLPAGLPFTNFTSDWNDGILLGALVDSCAPDLGVDWRNWLPSQALHSTCTAMHLAKDHLSIAPLIAPEELISPAVDERSVMTYLSQFPGAKYTPGMGRFRDVDVMPVVGVDTKFTLQMRDSAIIPEVNIKGPAEASVPYTQCRLSETVYDFIYQPKIAGEHKIVALVRNSVSGDFTELTSPKIVAVEGAHLLYDQNVQLGMPVKFRVENPGKDPIEVLVIAPYDKGFVVPVIPDGNSCIGQFTPKREGVYELNVFQKGNKIAGSPFSVTVVSQAQTNIWGRGLEPKGIQSGEEVIVYADYSDSLSEPPYMRVIGPCEYHIIGLRKTFRPKIAEEQEESSWVWITCPKQFIAGNEITVSETVDGNLHLKIFKYRPHEVGTYEVGVLLGEKHIGKSPYKVMVSPISNSKVRAFGPGLESGVANLPSIFLIETNGGRCEQIDVTVSGRTLAPKNDSQKPDIELVDNKNGSAIARFTPTVPGIYTVKVCVAGEHVKGSPFIVQVQPANNNLKVADMRLCGIKPDFSGVQGEDFTFWIEMPDTKVRLKPLVRALDEKYEEVPVQVMEIKPGQYECRFTPKTLGRYYFLLSVGGVAIPGSPFVVLVRKMIDASKIRIYGTGLGSGVHANQPVSFIIDPQNSGDVGKIRLQMHGQDGTPVNISLIDNGNETLTANYIASEAGLYELVLYYGDMELMKMNINVKPVDTSAIVVDGLDNGVVKIGHRESININTGNLTPMKNGLEVIVEEASGLKYMIPLEHDHNSAIHKGSWTAKNVGETKFSVFYDEKLVCESQIIVKRNQDAAKCRVTGDGLKRAVVGVPAKFQVDMKDAGGGRMKLAIKGPSESKTNVIDHSDGLCTVEYVPQTPGLYEISIYFGDDEVQIPGSPFTVLVDYEYDPSKILITGYKNGHVRAGVPASFSIDATRTALEPISARLPIGFQQPFIEEIKPRIYRVTFTPRAKAGEILPLEIIYGGQLLHGRPLDFVIEEEESELIVLKNRSGVLPSHVQASLRYSILIDATRAGKAGKLRAEIKGPDDKFRKSSLTETTDKGIYLLEFVPDMAGSYIIIVYGNGKPLHSKPYEFTAVPVGWANRCYIELKPLDKFWTIGEPKTFRVNANGGGEGALNIVSDRDDLEVKVEEQNDGYYLVTFTPHHEGPHRIALMYGGIDIPNGAFNFECGPPAVDEPEVTLLRREADFEECSYNVEEYLVPRTFRFSVTSNYHFEKLSASVRMPSGKSDVAHIKDNTDGSVTVTYRPRECGNHLLSVQHDGVNMSGSPISFYVSNAADGYVTVYGPGLTHAVVGEPAPFTVCAKGSPAKELAVAVEGTAKATIKCHDNKDGTCSVAWVPPVPGEYKVHVKLSGNPVKGSPFVVVVAGEGQKRAHLSVGSTSEVSLNVASTELKGLSASIKSPSGIEEPCFIRQIDSANIGVSFTPREEGEHLVTVKKNGQVIPKSPFRVKVDRSQVGDASKVIVSGAGKASAICQKFNDVKVDTRNAGLSVSVEGPSKAELKCTEAKEGLINIAYKPTEPGIYILSVKFADVHVKDSPFTVNCTGKGLGSVKRSATKEVNQAPMVLPNHDAVLYFQMENTSPMETTAKVMDPKGKSFDIEVRDIGSNLYQVHFKPEMDGSHAISVFNKGQHILGSPFQFTVGHMTEMGAHKVRAVGVGLLRGETNVKQSFNLYTREAGRGELEVIIEGPSEAELQFHDHKDGNCHFDYKVSKPGEYLIGVKFNSEHITDSPFKVFIAPATGEARRLELASFPDSGLPGKACTFTVLTHHAVGHLEAKVHTPTNKIETIDIVPIDEGESYALRFIPTETGNYYVDVTLDGAPMRDSPFRLRVGTNEDSDPTAITVSGDGIHGGQTGQKCEFIINTCNAGTGLLQIQVDGPSKLDLGYKVRYMALAPGVYYVDIKYAGVHIPGSPFKIIMAGKELGGGGEPDTSLIKIDALAKTSKGTVAQVPVLKGDASKVTVKGGGLNKFFPGRPAAFNIDTGLAGENLLFVGVLTSKGPCEEVTVRHLGSGRYAVTYRIQERVKGFIFIKYGETNVPGSPFAVSF